MIEYYAAIKSGRGGLMMAVCRGKVGLRRAGLDIDIAVCDWLVRRQQWGCHCT